MYKLRNTDDSLMDDGILFDETRLTQQNWFLKYFIWLWRFLDAPPFLAVSVSKKIFEEKVPTLFIHGKSVAVGDLVAESSMAESTTMVTQQAIASLQAKTTCYHHKQRMFFCPSDLFFYLMLIKYIIPPKIDYYNPGIGFPTSPSRILFILDLSTFDRAHPTHAGTSDMAPTSWDQFLPWRS